MARKAKPTPLQLRNQAARNMDAAEKMGPSVYRVKLWADAERLRKEADEIERQEMVRK